MLSSKVDSAGKAEDKGNAVESLRFEDEDNGSLLEMFPFDRLFTLEYKYPLEHINDNKSHLPTSIFGQNYIPVSIS